MSKTSSLPRSSGTIFLNPCCGKAISNKYTSLSKFPSTTVDPFSTLVVRGFKQTLFFDFPSALLSNTTRRIECCHRDHCLYIPSVFYQVSLLKANSINVLDENTLDSADTRTPDISTRGQWKLIGAFRDGERSDLPGATETASFQCQRTILFVGSGDSYLPSRFLEFNVTPGHEGDGAMRKGGTERGAGRGRSIDWPLVETMKRGATKWTKCKGDQ